MNIQTKFDIGQSVYHVFKTKKLGSCQVKCDVCNSTGKVKIVGQDGEYPCPVCQGHGSKSKSYWYPTYELAHIAKITDIRIEIYTNDDTETQPEASIVYRLSSIRNGDIGWIYETFIFLEKEAAQEFCDKYNLNENDNEV